MLRPFLPAKLRLSRAAACLSTWSSFRESSWSRATCNPLRDVVDKIKLPEADPARPLIPLSLGDPTVFGNLLMPEELTNAVASHAQDNLFAGYAHSCGLEESRAAVAAYYSTPGGELTGEDVVIASGGSGALEIALKSLVSPGENILLPQPGFPLYETLVRHYGSEPRFYRLQPDKSWEADLDMMASLVDDKTRALLICNPSNPCGSVFSRQHLEDILALAAEFKLPVIADEIYGKLVFDGHECVPAGSVTDDVPVIAVGGTAKEFLCPGWRVGWLMLHDRKQLLGSDFRTQLAKLTQLVVGANTLVQSALPALLQPTPGSRAAEAMDAWRATTLGTLQRNAELTSEILGAVPGLRVVMPQGAMYAMVEVKESVCGGDDVVFAQELLQEEHVFVIPGSCFGSAGFFRLVLCAPEHVLRDAYGRMRRFCERRAGAATEQAAAAADEDDAAVAAAAVRLGATRQHGQRRRVRLADVGRELSIEEDDGTPRGRGRGAGRYGRTISREISRDFGFPMEED